MHPRVWTHAVSVAVAIACGWLSYRASGTPSYPDFVAGWLGMHRAAKLGDLLALPAAATGWAVTFFWASEGRLRARPSHFGPFADAPGRTLLLAAVPALGALASWPMAAAPSLQLLLPSLFAALFAVAASAPLPAGAGLSQGNRPRWSLVGWGAFSALLLGLAPLCLSLFAIRLRPHLALAHRWHLPPEVTLGAQAISCLGTCLWLRLRWQRGRHDLGLLPYVAQLALPCGYAALVPMLLRDPEGQLFELPTHPWFKRAVVLFVVVLTCKLLWRLWRACRRNEHRSEAAWLPSALFVLVPLLRFPVTAAPAISPDDYHFGESLLGALFYAADYLPYLDYFPPHGFLEDDVAGLLSAWLYDGHAATFGEAGKLLFCALAFAAFWTCLRWSGSLWFAYLTALFGGVRLTFLLSVPFFVGLCSPRLQRRPVLYLLGWLTSCLLLILASPGPGGVLAVSSTPLVAAALWRRRKDGSRLDVAGGVAVAALVALTGWRSPVPAMVRGAVHYVLVNGPANQIAFGVAWAASWRSVTGRALAVEATRMSWVVLYAVCSLQLILALRGRSRRVARAAKPTVALLFVLGLLSYAMGRIDPLAPSRPGHLAVYSWAFLLPWTFWRRVPRRRRPLLLASCYAGAAAIGTAPMHPWWGVDPALQVPQLTDAAARGLHGMGRAIVHPEHLTHLLALKNALDQTLAPGEAYLDLTNRNAHYAYLGRRPPLATTSYYNMAAWPLQRDAVASLTAHPPRVALLSAGNAVHDGVNLALRAPLVYREVVDHYLPEAVGPFLFARRRLAEDGPLTEAQARLLFVAMGQRELERLPNAWGDAANSLRRRAKVLAGPQEIPVTAAASNQGVDLSFEHLGLSGREANILQLRLRCSRGSSAARVRFVPWGDAASGPTEGGLDLFATASAGTLLVPLDALPSWRALKQVRGVRVEVADLGGCPDAQFDEFALWQVR